MGCGSSLEQETEYHEYLSILYAGSTLHLCATLKSTNIYGYSSIRCSVPPPTKSCMKRRTKGDCLENAQKLAKPPRKSITWAPDESLCKIRHFSVIPGERINVNWLKQLQRVNYLAQQVD